MDHYESRETADNYHHHFGTGGAGVSNNESAAKRFSKFIERIPKGGHILDAGCGTGRFVRYFIESGYEVTGIDYSKAMLAIAIKENPGARFHVMDLRNLDFDSEMFHGVWNVATLVHLDESEALTVIKETNRVLKEGGPFFLATRTRESYFFSNEESTEGGKFLVHYHSPKNLKSMLDQTGFHIDELKVEPDDGGRPFDYIYIHASKETHED